MKVNAIKTKLIQANDNLLAVIQEALPKIAENSVLTIASKAFATAENCFVAKVTGTREEKHELVKAEADWYLPAEFSKYRLMHTIKRNLMFVNAGLDESNANNQYILWPKNPQISVNKLWQQLRDEYHIKNLGIIMTDSTSRPLSWGVVGAAVAYCGLVPLKSYVGKPDLYGRLMVMEQVSVIQSLAAAGTFVTGEGDECTPLGLIEDIPAIEFQDHVPSAEDLASFTVKIEDDAYAPMLTSVSWVKGGGGYNDNE